MVVNRMAALQFIDFLAAGSTATTTTKEKKYNSNCLAPPTFVMRGMKQRLLVFLYSPAKGEGYSCEEGDREKSLTSCVLAGAQSDLTEEPGTVVFIFFLPRSRRISSLHLLFFAALKMIFITLLFFLLYIRRGELELETFLLRPVSLG